MLFSIFAPLIGIAVLLTPWIADVHWPPWYLLTLLVTSYLILTLRRRMPLPILLLFGYVAVQGVSMFECRTLTEGLTPSDMMAIRLLAAHCVFEGLALLILFALFWRRIEIGLGAGMIIGGMVHSVKLIFDEWRYGLPNLEMKGLLGNQSLGASFTVMWMFMVIHLVKEKMYRNILIGLGVVTVLVSHSSISFVAMLGGGMALAVASLKRVREKLLVCGLLLGVVPYGLIIKGPDFFRYNIRYEMWPMFIRAWIDRGWTVWVFGDGAGSFKYYGPKTQIEHHFREGQWMLWTHNDWMQLLFEYGWIGLSLSLLVYGLLLKRSLGRPALFASVVATGIVMVGNYPLHIAITSLACWWIGAEVLDEV